MRFNKIYIEITTACNLSCAFCPQTSRAAQFMTLERFRQAAIQAKEFSDYLCLHLMGEPLLHPHLEQILAICAEIGLRVNLTTNGTLIKRAAPILLDSKTVRKVSFSLHSHEANVAGVSLEQYLGDIFDFVNQARPEGIFCELRLWNVDSSECAGFNQQNETILRCIGDAFQIQTPELPATGSIKLGEGLFLCGGEIFDWPNPQRADTCEQVFCHALRDHAGVLCDGTVVPCCLDSEGGLQLGNLFTQPLREILQSKRAQKIYTGFSARKATEPLCMRCGFARRF